MALQPQSVNINFSQGLDTKTDKFQVALGKFLRLQNTVFDKGGMLQKRNGYGALASLPNSTCSFTSTFNNNLTAVGDNFYAYSQGAGSWTSKGSYHKLNLDVQALIRSNTAQSYADSAIADNGLICTVYTDNIPSGGGSTAPSYKYVIADSLTGQNIVAPTVITPTAGTVTYAPKVFNLGRYFILVFNTVITGANHLQYIAISSANPTSVVAAANVSSAYTAASTGTFDGVVANNNLYLAWNGNDGGGAIRVTYITSTLTQGNTITFAGASASHVSVTADTSQSTPVIWISWYQSGSTSGKSAAVSPNLTTILAPTTMLTAVTATNLTSAATGGILTIFYQVTNAYGYDSGVRSDYIAKRTLTQAGVAGSPTVMARSVGLASKAFILSGSIYMLSIYSSPNQPTYFLLNSSGEVVSKLAYSNAGSYYITGLPNVTVSGSTASIPYLFKDLVTSVNKTQGVSAPNGVYTQTGINRVAFDFAPEAIVGSEIGSNLNVSGGLLWAYDGYVAVEQGFNLWPDSVEVETSASGGTITASTYFYQVVYEWTDNQGNIHRSAPSIPVSIVTTGSTSSNTIHVPTLRLTYKTANPVKIVIYRWSTAQQTYYQVTSVNVPLLNDTSTDSVNFVDTLPDSSIVGNSILYTTGGVLEDIGPPATSIMALWQTRLFLVDSEDRNLIWFSKQVIEATPVEMSDLLTIYVPPTTAAQGSTGPITALFALDDKLIIFKQNAIYYVTGQGPDNTGANNQFSDPVFITSTVGCDNPRSIVFIPQGIMFQSDKGIWLLDRNLQTSYIGAPVQDFTLDAVTQSAVNVPETNQVRFTLDAGITVMYDYYYAQFGVFVNIPAVSSTIYGGLHTYINSQGQVYQETPGAYMDGSKPVLISFTTSWINLAGLQGFQRAYEFYLLGVFKSPHKLNLGIAYDYNASLAQNDLITPINYSGNYGYGTPSSNPGLYGNATGQTGYGGVDTEWWRVFLQRQQCTSFQITLDEVFDASYGVTPGAGFTLSGIDLTVGVVKGHPRLSANRQAG